VKKNIMEKIEIKEENLNIIIEMKNTIIRNNIDHLIKINIIIDFYISITQF
jgi:hypothetical protein